MSKEIKKDTVMVEMTEAQKNKVVDLLAKEPAAPLPPVKMNLSFQHEVNNRKYGPGPVSVPAILAGHLETADHRAMISLLKQNQSSNTMIEILGRGMSRVVKG